jgi:ribA/ribD-fused uncharacterized protein
MRKLVQNDVVFMDPSWDNRRDALMEDLVRAKFTANPILQALLLTTGTATIEEASPRDGYWGTHPQLDGQPGQNNLGKILTKIRSEFEVSTSFMH